MYERIIFLEKKGFLEFLGLGNPKEEQLMANLFSQMVLGKNPGLSEEFSMREGQSPIDSSCGEGCSCRSQALGQLPSFSTYFS